MMKELLAELEAIRTLSERIALEIDRLSHHVDRAERQLRARAPAPLIITGDYRDDEDEGD